MSPAASPRWCPTPEQLMILEEMYKAGVQSPSASLIQQITAHLSRYGKIEGKNVFYWFQNHKARDKQKLRRKFARQLQQQQLQQLFRQQMSPNCSFCRGYQLNHHQCPSSMVVQGPPVPSASVLRQLSYHSSPPPSMSYPLQGGNIDGGGSRSIMDLTSFRRSEIIRDHDPQRVGTEKNIMKMYNEVRRMAMGTDSSELHHAKPLKTLELFPTTSSNLREDRCKSASSVDQV